MLEYDDVVRLRTGEANIRITRVYEDNTVDGYYTKSDNIIQRRKSSDFVLLARKNANEETVKEINRRLVNVANGENEDFRDEFSPEIPKIDDIVRLTGGTAHLKVIDVDDEEVTARYVSSLGYAQPLSNSIVTKHHDCFVLIQSQKESIKPENTQKESIMTKVQQQATEIGQSILNDHEKIAKVTVGRVLYENIRNVAQGYIKLSWFQRLFISKANLKLVELTTVYGILKVIQNNYDHYIIECVSLYIASELQHNLLSAIPLDIENLLKPIIRKG